MSSTIDNAELAKRLEDIPRRLQSVAWACARIGLSAQLEAVPSHRADLLEMRDACNQMADTILSALRGQEGMVLVPREPTEAMALAIEEYPARGLTFSRSASSREISVAYGTARYRAMIKAAGGEK